MGLSLRSGIPICGERKAWGGAGAIIPGRRPMPGRAGCGARIHPHPAMGRHPMIRGWRLLPCALLLAACGGTGSRPSLTIAINAGVEGDALKAAANEWAAHNSTRLEIVELPYANLFEKELLDLTSRTGAYDVIMM